jgi:hypothetical protein
MNAYWKERLSAVRDGGLMTNDDAWALADYVHDLETAAHFLINEPTELHRWFDLKTVLDSGPKIPED